LLDVLEPADRGQQLTNDDKQKAIEIIANKCLKNPVFAGKEGEVTSSFNLLFGAGRVTCYYRS
jgi:hypothetical protein